jgi:glycosyltransferase involved in cell wall biosynthesis
MTSLTANPGRPRVLYSFPHKLGAGRICWTAWQQVLGLHHAGADLTVSAGCAVRRPPDGVRLATTLALGPLRIPYRLLGIRRACMLHDYRTARWLDANWRRIDIVHTWPLGALQTMRTARRHGIPVVFERQNCHTAYAYRVVEDECRRLGVVLPEGYEHTYDPVALEHEMKEYEAADFLLCPSDFVSKTFLDEGFPAAKLLRHRYGYDHTRISVGSQDPLAGKPLVLLYAGLCSPRKGLHLALRAWLDSAASKTGRFLVCGEFAEPYQKHLESMLSQPGVEVLGHRTDLPDLMKQADLFILPSIEEGSALVTYEARGAGCVLLVSDAAGAVCQHLKDAMVHPTGDLAELTRQIDLLDRDRPLLAELRQNSIHGLDTLSWEAAGTHLASVYRQATRSYHSSSSPSNDL